MEMGWDGTSGVETHLQTAPEASSHTVGWPRHSPDCNIAQVQPMQPRAQITLCPLLPIVKGQDGVARAPTSSQCQLCMMPVTIVGPALLQVQRRGLEPCALHTQHKVAFPKLYRRGERSADHLNSLFQSTALLP